MYISSAILSESCIIIIIIIIGHRQRVHAGSGDSICDGETVVARAHVYARGGGGRTPLIILIHSPHAEASGHLGIMPDSAQLPALPVFSTTQAPTPGLDPLPHHPKWQTGASRCLRPLHRRSSHRAHTTQRHHFPLKW